MQHKVTFLEVSEIRELSGFIGFKELDMRIPSDEALHRYMVR